MTNYKYLGKRVKDVGEKGLDSPEEFVGILKEILKDYLRGDISERTARGRLLLLYRLTFPEKNRKVRKIPEKTLKKIRLAIRYAMKNLKELKRRLIKWK